MVRSVRGYSTSSEGLDFLSGLMKRIDNLNLDLKTKRDAKIAEAKESKSNAKTAKTGKNAKTDKSTTLETSKQNKFSLGTKNHPMLNNRFEGQNDRTQRPNFKGKSSRKGRAGSFEKTPVDRKNVNDKEGAVFLDARPKTQQKDVQATDGQTKPTSGANRTRSKYTKTAGARSKSKGPVLFSRSRDTTQEPRTKTLVSKPLLPSITGDHFLYGKPAAMGISLESRVAAITKRSLLESKYPYKLPRSIIDQLVPQPTIQNPFILKKDYDLNVKVEPFVQKVKEVVKGETQQLTLRKTPSALEKAAAEELMRNSTLNMAHKQHILDMVTGVKNANDVLKTAAWK